MVAHRFFAFPTLGPSDIVGNARKELLPFWRDHLDSEINQELIERNREIEINIYIGVNYERTKHVRLN